MEEKEYPVAKTEDQWRAELPDEAYRVLREGATEAPFSGELNESWDPGIYRCRACGSQLFAWDRKYEPGCGWPSFDEAIPGAVEFVDDDSHNMQRTEVRCANCGGHLGHVFDDGPEDTTGQRFCINSVSLQFDPSEALAEYERKHPKEKPEA